MCKILNRKLFEIWVNAQVKKRESAMLKFIKEKFHGFNNTNEKNIKLKIKRISNKINKRWLLSKRTKCKFLKKKR